MSDRPRPVVLAGPSGSGKTTLARRLVEGSDRFVFSVSATTRPPRKGERDGSDYHFVDRARFEHMIAEGALAEWAEVHGRLYGTPRVAIDAAAARGEQVVLDIDVQGARQIRRALPDALRIFVLPPNVDIMMSRLRGRATEPPAEIARRLRSALSELAELPDFDFVVVNDDLERCLDEIRAIVDGRGGASAGEHRAGAQRYRTDIEELLDREYREYA